MSVFDEANRFRTTKKAADQGKRIHALAEEDR